MIDALPCGCPTLPAKFDRLEMLLAGGECVLFDDPRCAEHNGSGISGMMILGKGKKVYSRVWIGGEGDKEAEFSLNKAMKQLATFNANGFEFSFGKAKLKTTDEGYVVICGG